MKSDLPGAIRARQNKKMSDRASFIHRPLGVISVLCVFLYVGVYFYLHTQPLSHDYHDSYTLQAMQWWKWKISLDQDYSYLELAKYKDKIFVSFPPLPSVIEFFLIPFFGRATPNNLMSSLYAILSFTFIVAMALRAGCTPVGAATWGGLLVIGTSLFPLSMFGGVWYAAQTLCFFLLTLCVLLLYQQTRKAYFYALICFALAIGCRPQTVFFLPAICAFAPFRFGKSDFLKYAAAPLAICALYAVYNYLRFDSVVEFGHNYLPEFQQAPDGQFSWHYLGENLERLFRLPTYSPSEGLQFQKFDGFAFYLANPVFIALGIRLVRQRSKIDFRSALLLLGCGLQLIFLLVHRGMGGWHFGSRYMVDMLPFVWLLILRLDSLARVGDFCLCAFALILNLYGVGYIYQGHYP
jgi:Gpi18-like mannosyltransferase